MKEFFELIHTYQAESAGVAVFILLLVYGVFEGITSVIDKYRNKND